jgi:hypothetical protein
MAVTIKQGDTITASRVKSGTNKDGAPYFKCVVDDGKKKTITLWDKQGFTCNEGENIRIAQIVQAKHGSHQYQDKWYEDFDLEVVLEHVVKTTNGFADLEENSDLPF